MSALPSWDHASGTKHGGADSVSFSRHGMVHMRSSVGRVKGLVGKGLKGAAKATAKGLLGQTTSNAISSSSSPSSSSLDNTHGAILLKPVKTPTSADGHAFVDTVIRRCERAWALLCGTNNDETPDINGNLDAAVSDDGSSLLWRQQDHIGAGLVPEEIMVATGNVVPFRARELLWSEVVQVFCANTCPPPLSLFAIISVQIFRDAVT